MDPLPFYPVLFRLERKCSWKCADSALHTRYLYSSSSFEVIFCVFQFAFTQSGINKHKQLSVVSDAKSSTGWFPNQILLLTQEKKNRNNATTTKQKTSAIDNRVPQIKTRLIISMGIYRVNILLFTIHIIGTFRKWKLIVG